MGRSLLSFKELSTVIVEIKGLLNTRPLTYISNDLNMDHILRPIDFLQKDLTIHYPMGTMNDELHDPSYAPPEQIGMLQTKRQAIVALQSSCELTEKFWHVWQTQYLTALREKHLTQVGKKKGCSQVPKEGAIVLICDSTQPRHSWKMGTITKLVQNNKGTTRETIVRLPSQRLIRRPVNLLVPLELEDDSLDNPTT
ncbi:hypothetical protein RB195_004600 [Necator americanus]|uniref:DUF5641 domain-containing protein n=1 Tax=Necator americanus TaxID=51031 RepID=A0ABR1BIT2_NECAM